MCKEKGSDDMNVEDLLEQLICERIEMLLNEHSNETMCEEKKFNRIMEEFFGQLKFWDDWATVYYRRK